MHDEYTMYALYEYMLVRWDADDRVEQPEVETESAFKLLKSRWSKSPTARARGGSISTTSPAAGGTAPAACSKCPSS